MSGYLQRMVSNARIPARSIHPILGSLYSAPKYGPPPESFQAAEDPGLSGWPEPGAKPNAGAQPVPARSLVPAPGNLRRDADSKPLSEEAAFPEPLVTPHRQATPSGEPIEISGERQSVRHAEAPEREAISRRPYKPLLEEADRPADAERVFANAAPQATGAIREPHRDPPHRVAPPERERDEIEIHIGRIEVTAVPQVAVRPAAQPARKSLNLDEYLKRRNRRA